GLAILVAMIGVIVVGPFVAPQSTTTIGLGTPNSRPSAAHWFGTDNLGRDVFSRFLHGGVQIMLIPVVTVILSLLIGGGLGVFAAYRGGLIDSVVTRLFDLILALPPLLLVLVLVAGLGTSRIV